MFRGLENFALPGLLLSIFFLFSTVSAIERTPLCDKCTCYNESIENPDVDCQDYPISGELYDETFYSNNNTLWPIKSLHLTNAQLRAITKVFPNSSLTILDLRSNYIKTIIDGAFQNLQQMVELDLGFNNLGKLGPNVFKGVDVDGYNYPLISLRRLKMNNNNIHSLDPDVFQHIEKQLEVLVMRNNPLKMYDESTHIAITGIYNLKELDLSYCGLKSLPNGFFHSPQYLSMVDLSGNPFEKVPEALGECHSLEKLVFNDIGIAELEKGAFPTIETLTILEMKSSKNLTKIGAHSLSGLRNLAELYIEDSVLEFLNPNALIFEEEISQGWPPVRKLSLRNNKLTYLNLELLASWEKLTYVDLSSNPWTCDCENQWMLEELIPILNKTNGEMARELTCGAPIEMEGKQLYNLYQAHSDMRCLDLYGNRPEKDGSLLMGLLIGILIGVPLVLFLLYAWQRKWFGMCDSSPAAYSRQFYNRTASEDLNF